MAVSLPKGGWIGNLGSTKPTRFELIINLKAAQALGITIPKSLPLRADKVIE